MAKFLYLISLLIATFTISFIPVGSSPSPSPSTNCSDVMMGMMDCLDYVVEGSNVAIPSSKCCDELKAVVKASPSCVCEGLKMASDYGIKLNMTRATGLPKACRMSGPDVGNCGASHAPAPAPAMPAPTPSPTVPPPTSPPTPSKTSPAPQVQPPTKSPPAVPRVAPPVQSPQPPSPAPSPSGSWKLSASMVVLCVGVIVASFS